MAITETMTWDSGNICEGMGSVFPILWVCEFFSLQGRYPWGIEGVLPAAGWSEIYKHGSSQGQRFLCLLPPFPGTTPPRSGGKSPLASPKRAPQGEC